MLKYGRADPNYGLGSKCRTKPAFQYVVSWGFVVCYILLNHFVGLSCFLIIIVMVEDIVVSLFWKMI